MLSNREVLRLYNRLLVYLIHHKPSRFLTENTKSLELAEKLVALTAAEDISPGAYLCAAFAQHCWRKQPQLSELASGRYLHYFRENQAQAYVWWAAAKRNVVDSDPVELPIGYEIVKKRLLAEGGPFLCSRRSDLSGGFNQHSGICDECTLKRICARGRQSRTV